MSLNIILSNLQKINVVKIVLVKIGRFYITKGKDAVLLNKIMKILKKMEV